MTRIIRSMPRKNEIFNQKSSHTYAGKVHAQSDLSLELQSSMQLTFDCDGIAGTQGKLMALRKKYTIQNSRRTNQIHPTFGTNRNQRQTLGPRRSQLQPLPSGSYWVPASKILPLTRCGAGKRSIPPLTVKMQRSSLN